MTKERKSKSKRFAAVDKTGDMMGVSGITALTIRSRDDLVVTHGGPSTKGEGKGKYVGWLMLPEERWAPLLNTEPVFDTAEEAEAYIRDILKQVRALPGPKTAMEFLEAAK